MATRSTISILNKDNSIVTIYCHNDGYLEDNGSLLYKYYSDIDKVKKIVSLGAMSYLTTEIEGEDACCFYHRDRNEELRKNVFSSYEEYKESNVFEEFNYLLKESDNKWYLFNKKTKVLEDLADKLLEEKRVSEEIKKMINSQRFHKKLDKDLPKKEVTNNLKKI